MASFKCKDIGLSYSFEATAKTEDILMKKTSEHAKTAHNMKTILPGIMQKAGYDNDLSKVTVSLKAPLKVRKIPVD